MWRRVAGQLSIGGCTGALFPECPAVGTNHTGGGDHAPRLNYFVGEYSRRGPCQFGRVSSTQTGGPSQERYRRTSRGTPSFVIATGVMSPCSSKRISSMQTTRWFRSVSPRGLL